MRFVRPNTAPYVPLCTAMVSRDFVPQSTLRGLTREIAPLVSAHVVGAHMNDHPPSIAKNWEVWKVPFPSISVATK